MKKRVERTFSRFFFFFTSTDSA